MTSQVLHRREKSYDHCIKRGSIALVIREIQFKATNRYYYTHTRMETLGHPGVLLPFISRGWSATSPLKAHTHSQLYRLDMSTRMGSRGVSQCLQQQEAANSPSACQLQATYTPGRMNQYWQQPTPQVRHRVRAEWGRASHGKTHTVWVPSSSTQIKEIQDKKT